MKDGVPQTLQEAITYFADAQTAHDFAVKFRWPGGITCVHCGSMKEHVFISTRKLWRCRDCKKQFSVRLGTVMEDSPLSLSKWMTAMWLLSNCKNGISSYEIARDLGISQKSAWHLMHRVRAAQKAVSHNKKLRGIVEADECFVGGLFKFMHDSRKARVRAESEMKGAATSRGQIGKTLVQAVLERDGEIRTQVIRTMGIQPRKQFLEENVEAGSQLMTDEGYNHPAFAENFIHAFVNHEIEYAVGAVYCNGVENFWSLLKRSLKGTYVCVEPFHLSRYVDEQAFRFNTRKDNDAGRFEKTFSQISGRRLTWAELTRKPSVN
jgi:transposase-like protein